MREKRRDRAAPSNCQRERESSDRREDHQQEDNQHTSNVRGIPGGVQRKRPSSVPSDGTFLDEHGSGVEDIILRGTGSASATGEAQEAFRCRGKRYHPSSSSSVLLKPRLSTLYYFPVGVAFQYLLLVMPIWLESWRSS